MASALTAARVRSDVDVLSRAGLGLDEFLAEAVDAVSRSTPWTAACASTHDPETLLLTSARKYGALEANNEHDAIFGSIEYGQADATSFSSLARSESPAVVMSDYLTSGVRSLRMDELMRPIYDFGDEARLVFRDELGSWGALALFRGRGESYFRPEDAEFLGSLSTSFARGVRAGILARVVEGDTVPIAGGPAVVIVNRDDEVAQISFGAQERLASFGSTTHAGDPMCFVTGLVAAARRVTANTADRLPRVRIRTEAGTWLVLHASPLESASGATGDVVVTIEEARPPEIVSLVVAAFGLTPRERDVTRLVLQGVETKEMAAALHLSAYTVQDHLKVIFDKAGVRSRRELISRVYFDQYVPRIGTAVGPSGWVTGVPGEA